MSKINDLIKETCQNGVKKYILSDIVNFENGKGHEKVVSKDGKYILLTSKAISTRLSSYRRTNEQLSPLYKDDITMVMSDLPNGRALAKCFLVDEDDLYTLNQRVCRLSLKVDFVIPKYLWYLLNRNNQLLKYDNGVDQTNLRKDDILKIELLIPSKEVQEEIVRILDKFGELESELESELEAELEARKSQYEFWRDKVFEPKDTWTSKTMEELCTIITKQTGFDYSATIKPSLLDSKSDETYSFIQNKDFDGIRFNFDTDYYIPKNVADKYPKITLDCPSILFSISGKIGNVGLYESEKKAFIGGAIAICKLQPNLNNKYILYYLQSKYGQQYLFGNIKAASHLNVTVEAIRKINIKFPPLDEQKKIVNILDKFEDLTNDISVGLPAEIELRRKQYEYYRNKLLSFEEVIVSE